MRGFAAISDQTPTQGLSEPKSYRVMAVRTGAGLLDARAALSVFSFKLPKFLQAPVSKKKGFSLSLGLGCAVAPSVEQC